ncbi:MAG: hypothetical protein JF619_02530 [Massilia sp.]|nr:hypothetical protein [Massilia sp.]
MKSQAGQSIVAIVLLVLLAMVTVNPGAAMPAPPLSMRLRAHVTALAAGGPPDQPASARRADAAAYIDNVLQMAGYAVQDRGGGDRRNIEAVLANVAPGAKAARTFIVGARYDGTPDAVAGDPGATGSTAAVLELARLLADVRPSRGTEIRFLFFLAPKPGAAVPAGASLDDLTRLLANGPGERPGSFIAYVGSLASSRQVRDALSAFQSLADVPARGLATPAYMQGVTLSDRAAWHHPGGGLPALVLTDTSFTRFPYRQADADANGAAADDPPEKIVFAGMARVVSGLARTLTVLAAGQRG